MNNLRKNLEKKLIIIALIITILRFETSMAPKLPPKPIREQARVLFPYTAQNDDELTIKEGDIITIINKENEDVGWWKGELNGRIALFPDNFVEIIKQPSLPASTTSSTSNLGSSSSVSNEIKKIKKPDRSTNSENSASNIICSTSTEPSSLTTAAHGSSNKSKSSKPLIPANDVTDDYRDQMKDDNAILLSSSNDNSINDSVDESLSLGNNSKLEHLTKNRPKIPSNSRRPPSLYFPKDFEIISIPSEICLNGNGNIVEPGSPQSVGSTDSTNESRLLPNKTVSSPPQEKMLPWMLELKQAQDRKREQRKENNNTNDNSKLNNKTLSSPLSTILNKSQGTNANSPLNKPFVSKSSKPSLTSHVASSNVTNEPSLSASDNNSQLKISSALVTTSNASSSALVTSSKLSSVTTTSTTLSGHDKLPPTSPTTNAYSPLLSSLTKQEIKAELQDLHGKLKELDDKFQSYVRQQNMVMDKMVSFK